jgi:hypothetical protein
MRFPGPFAGWLILLMGSLAVASTPQTARQSETTVDNVHVPGRAFADQEWRFVDLGLTMQLPAGSTVTRLVAEEFPVWQVESGPGQPAWSMRVQSAAAPDPATDLVAQAKAATEGLALTGGTVRVLRERSLKAGECEARVVWATAVRGEQSTVAGWMLIRTGPGVFLSLGVLTSPEAFPEVEPRMDAVFASARAQDPRQMQADRNARVQRGDALRATLTPDRLRSLTRPGSELSRIWRPAADGSITELGWVEMAVRAAPRAEASLQRAASTDPLAREEGLLVLLTARMNSADGVDRVETQARYWVAWDLGSEAWVVRSVQRGSGPEVRFEQMGLRPRPAAGRPGASLVVASQSTGASPPVELEIPPGAYLPQAVAMLLGSLLPQEPGAAGESVFYALDPATARMCQRPVSWQSGAGGWTLVTRNTPETAPVTERFGPNGGRLERIEPDGTRTTPSTLEEIRKRWKAMGLEP